MFEAWGSLPLAGVVLAACLVALVGGGPVERRGAAVYALALLVVTATRRLTVPTPAQGAGFAFAELGFDGALFTALFCLSWKSSRAWPVWAAMLQAVAIGVNLAAIARPELAAHVRALALWVVGLGQASIFGWGTIPPVRVLNK